MIRESIEYREEIEMGYWKFAMREGRVIEYITVSGDYKEMKIGKRNLEWVNVRVGWIRDRGWIFRKNGIWR